MRESREVRNERLTRQAARQLAEDFGLDGYAADAIVRAVAQDKRHAWAPDVLRAGLRSVALNAGMDVTLNRLSAAYARTERAIAAFAAEMAVTYAEMDDEFRQHPEIGELDRFFDDFYDEEP